MPRQAEFPFALEKPAAGETSRSIALGDRIVPYVLRRTRRRTIGLSIDQRGLRVGAPPRATLAEIETLIRKHGEWVGQKLDVWRERRRSAPQQIADGTQLPYLGGTLVIRLTEGNNHVRWEETAQTTLTLCLRAEDQAASVLEKALRRKALEHFAGRLAHQAGRLAMPAPPLRLSSARTRWGSCSLKTGIRVHWRLIHCAPRIIDYVIVHELAHLREMNHGPRFWAIVDRYCPDYRSIRSELKTLSGSLPEYA